MFQSTAVLWNRTFMGSCMSCKAGKEPYAYTTSPAARPTRHTCYYHSMENGPFSATTQVSWPFLPYMMELIRGNTYLHIFFTFTILYQLLMLCWACWGDIWEVLWTNQWIANFYTCKIVLFFPCHYICIHILLPLTGLTIYHFYQNIESSLRVDRSASFVLHSEVFLCKK